MTRTSPPQVAFSSGELDPLLHRRFDYQRFQTGLAQCRGFLPLAQGGFTRAPGTIMRGSTKDNRRAILLPFQFAEDDALTLEFTEYTMRVWRYGALVMKAGAPFELVTPYDLAALDRLRWVQSADVIYLCDGVNAVQRLARLALDDWTISSQTFRTGPFRVQNLTKSHTVQASGRTGSITLTASSSLFKSGHVGSLMMLAPTDQTTIGLFTTNEVVTVGDMRRYGENVYQLTMRSGANVGQNPPIHSEGEALTDNNTKWKFISDGFGTVRITAVTNSTTATANVLKTVPQACVSDPTYRWSEGAWSDRYGYPASVELYDQRLVFAATKTEPRSLWFSTIGDFSDFAPGVEADSAFSYTIAGEGTINRIVNLRNGRSGLHIFALGEEYSTRSDSRAQVIGPTTAVFGIDSAIGSSMAKPITPYGNPIFISRDKRRVMMISYDFQQDANQAQTMSRIAQHIGASGFEQIVWQSAPEPIAWLRQTNGNLVAMIHDPAEEVLGWAVVPVADGFVESLSVSPDAVGSSDVVTAVVRRVIDGVTVRLVEDLAPIYGVLTGGEDIDSACHLYSAAIFAPMIAEDSFVVPHLAGASVYAWTSAGEFGPMAVAIDGSLTLPVKVMRAVIGLFDPTHVVETLDIQAATPDGNSMGRQKRLFAGLAVAMHRSAQGRICIVERDFAEPQRVGKQSNLVPRAVATDMTAAFSGVARIDLPSGHAKELAIRIQPYNGAPLTITGITPTVQEAGN